MRTAILFPNFVDSEGSASWVGKYQTGEMAGNGNYVAVFALAANIKPENADLFIIDMPGNLFWQRIYRLVFPLDIFKTIRWLRKLKSFDLIITHQYPLTWLAYLARKFYRVKYTCWYHGIAPPRFSPHLHERIYTRIQIFLTRLTVKNADRAISVSDYCRQEFKEYTGLDSEVIYNRLDLDKFYPEVDGTEIRRKYDLGTNPVILFVGALRPVKGVHLLVQAFKLVKEKIPDARLIIVGRPTYPYYFEEIRRLSDSSVTFVDFVPHASLPPYYTMCDLYASCTLWESFNNPIVEAQACGKSVVVFDIGPHPEVVDSNGILVEAENVEEFARACIKKLREVRGL